MGGCISGTQEYKKQATLGKLISETTKDGSCVFDIEVMSRNSKKTLTNNGEFLFSKKQIDLNKENLQKQIMTLNLKDIAKKAELKRNFKAAGLDDLVEVLNDNAPIKLIQVIHLEHHQMSSLPDISYFFNIRKVYLNQNQFENIVDLSSLKNLTYLNMSKNKINEISNLDQMVNLEQLHLNDNNIEKMENLGTLTSLKVLSLENNKISKMQCLRNMKKLKLLNLKGNLIEFIEDLWYLNELSVLDLDENPLDFRTSQTALILLKSRKVKVTVGTFSEQ